MSKFLAGLVGGVLLSAALPCRGERAAGPPPNDPEADWSKAQEFVVELGDHHYSPSELSFAVGHPVVLRLKNVGNTSHDMIGGSFFRAIMLKMARGRSGHVVATGVHSIYIRPKQEMELWFLPIQRGEFSFFCSIPGHQEAGMEGVVTIR